MNLLVKATVVDIRSVDPDPQDEYIVDTNAWYWMTYSRASVPSTGRPHKNQTTFYPRYLKKAIESGAILHRCDISFAELSHNIEECEKEMYVEFVAKKELSLKEYRHGDDEERKNVVSEIESVWSQVQSMSQCVAVPVEKQTTDTALDSLKQYRLDGYDVLLLEAMKRGKVTKIITDDGDFGTVDGIEVYTCNPTLLNAAKQQNKLKS